MNRLLCISVLAALFGCTVDHAQRCNPLRATNDCDPGLTCIYPTTPSCSPSQPGTNCCGISFCCALDANGNIIDKDPNCQPDPIAAMACFPDMNMSVAPPRDGSTD